MGAGVARRRKGRPLHGWLVVDKPGGMTSTQVVGRVRRALDAQKVGHGGTLDPLATGVLPLALGEATKTVNYIVDAGKSYRFTLRWGQETSTDDSEGAVVAEHDKRPTRDEIEAGLGALTGEIAQIPPRFSAIKVDGRRAYDMARAQESFDLEPRQVRIDRFALVAMDDADHARFEVDCGKGAYMRALARDLGRALGTAAHITALRRTAVGGFDESRAISLETLESLGHSAAASGHLLPLDAALADIPALALSEMEAGRLRCGQAVSLLARVHKDRIQGLHQGAVVYATSGGTPVALARFKAGTLLPIRVLNL